MNSQFLSRNIRRKKRLKRVRGKIVGTKEKPRINVFCSLRYFYVQAVDDDANRVLASANFLNLSKKDSKEKSKKTLGKQEQAEVVGKEIAKKCLKLGIKKVVFDRGGYKYHGKIKILAEAMRKEGLEF